MSLTSSVPKPMIDGNTNTGLIKLFAALFMIIDHIGAVFFPGVMELRIIGRIAFPLYVWCTVIGVEYTKNHWKYAFTLLCAAFISQPFYMWGLNHKWTELNVMFTLFFGLAGMISIKEKKYCSHIWGPILVLLAGCAFKMDYGWKGILLALFLYGAREKRSALACVYFAFCLFWGTSSSVVSDIFGISLKTSHSMFPYGNAFFRALCSLQFMAFLAAPIILFRDKRRFHMPKLLGYAIYPGHLAVIALVRFLMTRF